MYRFIESSRLEKTIKVSPITILTYRIPSLNRIPVMSNPQPTVRPAKLEMWLIQGTSMGAHLGCGWAALLLNAVSLAPSVKHLTKIQVNSIHSLYLMYLVGHLVIEGDQASQAEPAPHKHRLAASDHLTVLYVPCDHS